MQPLEFYTEFIAPLELIDIPYFVTGSIASIFYGEPRLTHDIDIVIHLSPSEILKLISFFPLEKYYCPPEEVIRIESKRRPYGHFNLISIASGLKADIYLDANDPLHEWAFNNRKRISLGNNLELWLAPPEYVIIRKLEIGDLYSIIESEWPEKKESLHSRNQYKLSQKSRCSINTQ